MFIKYSPKEKQRTHRVVEKSYIAFDDEKDQAEDRDTNNIIDSVDKIANVVVYVAAKIDGVAKETFLFADRAVEMDGGILHYLKKTFIS